MNGCRNSKNLTRVSPEKLSWFNTCTSGRIHHNLEEFDNSYCNSQEEYKMRSDDFSPYTLIRCHRCSGFYLPSTAQSLKNQNKLSMEISYQLF